MQRDSTQGANYSCKKYLSEIYQLANVHSLRTDEQTDIAVVRQKLKQKAQLSLRKDRTACVRSPASDF